MGASVAALRQKPTRTAGHLHRRHREITDGLRHGYSFQALLAVPLLSQLRQGTQTLRRSLFVEKPLPPPDLGRAQLVSETPEIRPPEPELHEIDWLVQEKLLE